jgi:ATP-binding cassette subfamily C protein
MGLLEPDEGQVLVDGVSLLGADRLLWRASVSYVPQDVFLHYGTVRENLLRGCADATEAEMIDALKAASAGFVFGLPLGLDTLIGDGEMALSGGERQRIALARGLLRRPAIIVLDEVTSSLDNPNAERIRNSITALAGRVTVVVIGHWEGFHDFADQVIELEDGQMRGHAE